MNVLQNGQDFTSLTLTDLLAARELFHPHLMNKPNVVGTAIGRYRIRNDDGATRMQPRTLENSSVQENSWPAILVFVERWVEVPYLRHPDEAVPRAVYMPDGKRVPICVVCAPTGERAPDVVHPSFRASLIGGGFPVIAEVQNREHVASVGCLVTDGHTSYAVTNRHVSGNAGETVYSVLAGNKVAIGTSCEKSRTRVSFSEVYPNWPGKDTYVNMDIGLVKVDDITRWTTDVYGLGTVGPVADFSTVNLTLNIIGQNVKAHGAAGGAMDGEVAALFYRFKSMGGFEYVCDLLIGPRQGSVKPLGTRPGDSGTLWVVDDPTSPINRSSLAVQWGGQTFDAGTSASTFALATFLSSICNELEVDLLRDWQSPGKDYWGAVGHYGIASIAIDLLSSASKNLQQLMSNNRDRISYDLPRIKKKNMAGLSKLTYVPLADVPDMVWKVGPHKRGGMQSAEHPNHFADMDRRLDPPLPQGATLLEICDPPGPQSVNVAIWQQYYGKVQEQFPEEEESRGLLPFRCWQIYDEMVRFLKAGDVNSFVCAAGILSHYVGDSCQPLHISYLFNGDPDRMSANNVPYAKGVHSAYEDDMVDNHVDALFGDVIAQAQNHELVLVDGGQNAAIDVVRLMQFTFDLMKPMDIVEAYAATEGQKPAAGAEQLWRQFGAPTTRAMAAGASLLSSLWASAWGEGQGDKNVNALDAIDEDTLAGLYQDPQFLVSKTLDTIGPLLKSVPNGQAVGINYKPKRPRKMSTTGPTPALARRQNPPRRTRRPAR